MALQNGARDFDWQSRGEARVARNAARVFAALVGAADDDIFDLLGFEFAAGEHGNDRAGEKIVGAHFGEGACIAAERSALAVVNVCVEHGISFR